MRKRLRPYSDKPSLRFARSCWLAIGAGSSRESSLPVDALQLGYTLV
jgi:hypothetical protein